jgi:hypothetical protein
MGQEYLMLDAARNRTDSPMLGDAYSSKEEFNRESDVTLRNIRTLGVAM